MTTKPNARSIASFLRRSEKTSSGAGAFARGRRGKAVIATAGLLLAVATASANAAGSPSLSAWADRIAPGAQRSVDISKPATLCPGSKGEAVSELQRRLVLLGSTTKVTGVFDSPTEKAVKKFQRAHALKVDGLVGPRTRAALAAAPGLRITGNRAELAQQIVRRPGITADDFHSGHKGQDPESSARSNLRDTAAGKSALTSRYGDAHGKRVDLDTDMLRGLLQLNANHGFRLNITELAGGDHSKTSWHYAGTTFDVNEINGVHVAMSGKGRELAERLQSACTFLGATQVLGPGDRNHDTHVHCGWPQN
ncbi:peptidoglycan-binding protein [Kitasatospora sp. NPDC059646]|uniref:peptidoglycan-binding domain-containing protein n=1 Tax=Kitasatospora sp. NPDC059646 TaxID=3346893 RepID=UPI0036812610